MKKMNMILMLGAFCAVSAFAVLPELHAADAKTIKKQFKDRHPKMTTLKKAGMIGETDLGYVAVVTGKKLTPEDQKVVDAENADRKTIYNAIAKQQKTTAELVGKRRALQNFEHTEKGESLFKDGKWVQK